jgi:hypothetical protein
MNQQLTLTTAQSAALDTLKTFATAREGHRMMTLEGFAGTGKTTIVSMLVHALADEMSIAIAAPTNKAVGVLQSKVGVGAGVDFGSIHSFLGLRLNEREDGTRECRPEGQPTLHEYSLVVVDEASMIGSDLFARIITGARHGTRVLFVGDPAQLPPVEPGQPQALSPVFARVQHKVVLTEVVRQAAGNPIIALSMRIRESIEAGHCMPLQDVAEAADGERVWLTHGGEGAAFNAALGALQNGLDARIVAYRNAVVDRYNTAIHGALYDGPAPFAIGERVIVHEAYDQAREQGEDWSRCRRVSLYTSEEATVESIEIGRHPYYHDVPAYRVELNRDGCAPVQCFIVADQAAFLERKNALWSKWREAKLAEEQARMDGRRDSEASEARKSAAAAAAAFSKAFAPLKHVYAMTAHKSQGSTIDSVIVDFGDLSRMRDPFDFNRALYVAVTRAANNLAVVA